jgi:hypothetical protein
MGFNSGFKGLINSRWVLKNTIYIAAVKNTQSFEVRKKSGWKSFAPRVPVRRTYTKIRRYSVITAIM